jgi:predicted GNAT family acetyltransferase
VSTEVADNPDEDRYEILVDGHLAGFINYQLKGSQITLWHTETEAGYEGRGHASELAKVALDDVKQRGLELVPLCGFVVEYVRNHADEYLDMVAASHRDKVMASGD